MQDRFERGSNLPLHLQSPPTKAKLRIMKGEELFERFKRSSVTKKKDDSATFTDGTP